MSLRGPAFIPVNLIGKDYATVSLLTAYASAEPTELKALRLKTDEPSETARILTVDPLATRWKASFTKGVAREVTGMALINVPNLTPWGKYRFTVGEPTYQDLAPTTVVGTPVNFGSGIPADVDEAVFTPDDRWMIPFLGDYWNVELGGFPTPTTAPIHGDSKCWVSLFVRYTGGTPTNAYPAAGVTLKQGGNVVANLGTRAITSAEGQILVFPFDAADLPTASGAGLSVLCEFDSSNVVAELGACRVAVERTAPAQASPWLPSPSAAYGDEEDAFAPFIDLQYFPTTPWTITANDLLFVQVQDDQTEHDPDNGTVGAISFYRVPKNNIDIRFVRGYVDAGVFVAGEAFILGKHNIGEDSPGLLQNETPTGRIVVEGFEGVTEGGQTYGSDAFRSKAIDLQLCVDRDEMLTLQERIAWRKGYSSPFFFAAEPDIPVQRQLFNSGWWTVAEMSQPTRLAGSRYDNGDGTTLFVINMSLKGRI